MNDDDNSSRDNFVTKNQITNEEETFPHTPKERQSRNCLKKMMTYGQKEKMFKTSGEGLI